MKNELLTDDLKIEKAKKEDWNEVLALLEETNLIDRISGKRYWKKITHSF